MNLKVILLYHTSRVDVYEAVAFCFQRRTPKRGKTLSERFPQKIKSHIQGNKQNLEGKGSSATTDTPIYPPQENNELHVVRPMENTWRTMLAKKKVMFWLQKTNWIFFFYIIGMLL